MSLSTDCIAIRKIEGAGRGVIAKSSIPKGAVVSTSEPPAAHVIFREYRKEVCAQCFHYDRGRTLPTRHQATGKVFCTAECEQAWLEAEGELGLEAWETMHRLVQSKSNAVSSRTISLVEGSPDANQIAAAWAKREAKHQTNEDLAGGGDKQKQKKACKSAETFDADILGYLLSGILFESRHPGKWREKVLDLAMDETPYPDGLDLESHCRSFEQLSSILPPPLQAHCTSRLCQQLVNATSHNSFGLRSGSEDGEEYMGYALYPDASYFNHSCSPNISKRRKGNRWEFRAAKDIVEDEECCITYLGGDEDDLGVEARRARLRSYWGFECMCHRCVQESRL